MLTPFKLGLGRTQGRENNKFPFECYKSLIVSYKYFKSIVKKILYPCCMLLIQKQSMAVLKKLYMLKERAYYTQPIISILCYISKSLKKV